MPNGHRRVFFSYALENAEFARKLASLMSRRGVSVFLDMNIKPGDIWRDALRSEIEKASALVLLVPSRDVTNRNSLWFEAGAAKALGKPILAVLPPQHRVSEAELPTNLAGVLVLDADQRSLESIADMLVQAVPENAPTPVAN